MGYISGQTTIPAMLLILVSVGEGFSETPVLFRDSVLEAMQEHVKLIVYPSKLVSSDEAVHLRLKVCREMMVGSLEILKETIQRFDDLGEVLTEVETDELRGKLTYAIIDHETCLDAFEELKESNFSSYQRNKEVIKNLKDAMNKGRQLVSKSLSVLSKTLGGLAGLGENNLTAFPYWFGPEDQKALLACEWIPNITVANDGTGDYLTIGEAVAKVPEKGSSKFVIHVKEGLYRENVTVSRNNVVMYGDGKMKTVVTGSLNRFDNPKITTTFQTATFSVRGNRFVVMDMKFVNAAGPEKNQAVAFHSRSSQSVMYRCAFEGFQDTLYAHAGDQFYRECDIVGTVDFIFGAAAAIFQSCNIQSRKPLGKQINTVTAQGASDRYAKSGFAIVGSRIMPFQGENFTTFLGRPWKPFATVLVMKTLLGDIIDPKGWVAWDNKAPPTTLTYGEYKNIGPGSGLSNRVDWIGYKPNMSDEEAHKYSVDAWINRDGWLNQTCVPYDGSL